VLKQALERDYTFIVEDLMDGRMPVTPKMIELLLIENQKKLLASLIAETLSSYASRPRFLDVEVNKYRNAVKNVIGSHLLDEEDEDGLKGMKPLTAIDIVRIALDMKLNTTDMVELLKILRNEIKGSKVADKAEQLDYKEFFRLFIKLRKVKLIRYLFNQRIEFEFTVQIFIMALEEDCYDMAMLLHKEFRYLMRENSQEENKQIVSLCVASINKSNLAAGMIEYKCFLLREYLDHFQLRHARSLLDYIYKKIEIPNKFNILVNNFNVLKTGCLLIELLAEVGDKFD